MRPGLKRFCADVEFMSGTQPSLALKICWAACCPACLLWIAVADVFLYSEPLKLGEYTFPSWATGIGFYSVTVALQIMAGFAIYHWYKCGWDVRKALRPVPDWGPKDPDEYREYVRFLQERGMHPLSEQEQPLIPEGSALPPEAGGDQAAAASPGPASPPAEPKKHAPVPAANAPAAVS
ncbi:sodium- and chloride-dependent glycine transporter 2-like [Haemaphysalis longicornis]